MPIRPLPQTFYCPKCGWQKTTAPLSDALGPGDFYTQCPKCGAEKIEIRNHEFQNSFDKKIRKGKVYRTNFGAI